MHSTETVAQCRALLANLRLARRDEFAQTRRFFALQCSRAGLRTAPSDAIPLLCAVHSENPRRLLSESTFVKCP